MKMVRPLDCSNSRSNHSPCPLPEDEGTIFFLLKGEESNDDRAKELLGDYGLVKRLRHDF